MLAAESVSFDTGVFIALLGLGGTAVLALVGWVLSQAVTLGRIVARLESSSDDHERRLADLERRRGEAG